MRRSTAAWAVLALVVSLTTACSEEGSKAGGGAVPVTLRIGTDDEPGRPAADQIQEFGRQVEALSDGQITVEPVWKADGQGQQDWDQRVARMVVSGELDMGLIPSRAWDTEGVTTLRALNAPFLVNSEALLARVVSADIADGHACRPGHGRDHRTRAASREHATGVLIRGAAADTGAVPGCHHPRAAIGHHLRAVPGARRDGQRCSGRRVLRRCECRYRGRRGIVIRAGGIAARQTVATGNLVLFPKVNSLVVNSERFAGLTEAQQGILRKCRRCHQGLGHRRGDRITHGSDRILR